MVAVNEKLEISVLMVVVIGLSNKETAQALMNEGLDTWESLRISPPQTFLPFVQWFAGRVDLKLSTI